MDNPQTIELRILHVLAPALFGGLEQVVAALAAAQQRNGLTVTVALILDRGLSSHPLIDQLESTGVTTYVMAPPTRAYRLERRLVTSLCERVQPSIMHTHGYRADVLHGSVARALDIPSVATVHGFTGGDRKNRVFEWLQRRCLRNFNAVVAVSRPLMENLAQAGVPTERLHCVPNAWTAAVSFATTAEARHALGLSSAGRYVGFLGRMNPPKGPDLLIEALPLLQSRATVVMVGDGATRSELERRAESLGIADRVHWLGSIEGAARYMKAFDLLVLSSRTEGTPMVLLEAMAAEVPIVAASVGGVPHMITGDEAVLVPPEDPAQLAKAIDGVLAAPRAAEARSQRARDKLESHFTEARWVERYSEIYRSCRRALSRQQGR